MTLNNDDGLSQVATSIADGTITKTDIRILVIDTKVTAIADNAFPGYTNITEIIFNENSSQLNIGFGRKHRRKCLCFYSDQMDLF